MKLCADTQEKFNELQKFIDLRLAIGERAATREWDYFIEYARHFKNNPPEIRYGILIMDQDPVESNMLYSDCPRKLRLKHLEALRLLGTGNPGERQRHFINWLEKMEGKQ